MCTTAEALQTSHRTTTHALFLAHLSEVPARLQEQRQQAEKFLKLERSAPKIGQVVNGLSSESAAARTNPRNLVNIFPHISPKNPVVKRSVQAADEGAPRRIWRPQVLKGASMHDLMQLHGYQKLAGLLHLAFASLSCSSPTPAARAQAGMLRPDGEVVLRPMSDASFAQAQRVLHVLSCAALFPKLQLS